MYRLSVLITAVLISAGCDQKPAKAYTADVCPVSGRKLGEHGAPYVFVRDGQEVKLCCEPCLDKFNQDPAKYLKEIAAKN